MTIDEAKAIVQDVWCFKSSDKYSEQEIRQALDIAIDAMDFLVKALGFYDQGYKEGYTQGTMDANNSRSCGECQYFKRGQCMKPHKASCKNGDD